MCENVLFKLKPHVCYRHEKSHMCYLVKSTYVLVTWKITYVINLFLIKDKHEDINIVLKIHAFLLSYTVYEGPLTLGVSDNL